MSATITADIRQILKTEITLTSTTTQKVLVSDEVEGDMTFTFMLSVDGNDTSSFTRLNIQDALHAEVQIFNADPQKVVFPSKLIDSGTYQREYALLLNFELGAADSEGRRRCVVVFYIQRLEDHANDSNNVNA